MTDSARPIAELPRGFHDIGGRKLAQRDWLIGKLAEVYARYGFERLSTPIVEYADALGKFLPDKDRPHDGVFFFRDGEDDEKAPWLVLRYDLTAPLARYVAENINRIALPYRRFQTGPVFRNEKPGPGRFREFIQFDADTVGTASMAADAEFCMLVSDSLNAIGLKDGEHVVKVNNRKILNGVLELIGIPNDESGDEQRGTVLRAMDKLDRLGPDGVALLLGKGRKDESGDFTPGAGLERAGIDRVLGFLSAGAASRAQSCAALGQLVAGSQTGEEGVAELAQMDTVLTAAGFGDARVAIDPSVVRGLAYYTGPVFEAQLTFETVDEEGRPVRFGSVGGGGRYDGLVERFLGRKVPATGVSIGVSRLVDVLEARGIVPEGVDRAPVVVLVLDKAALPGYQAMVSELRNAGIAAELYLGESGMRAQLKYADRRRAPIAIIEGSDERAKGEVTIRDLALGAQGAADAKTKEDWTARAQKAVKRGDLLQSVREILARS
ncbi:MAG: histidine--tRNA ligase [Rhizomicrobium sp.]